jgi:hypothetical protein
MFIPLNGKGGTVFKILTYLVILVLFLVLQPFIFKFNIFTVYATPFVYTPQTYNVTDIRISTFILCDKIIIRTNVSDSEGNQQKTWMNLTDASANKIYNKAQMTNTTKSCGTACWIWEINYTLNSTNPAGTWQINVTANDTTGTVRSNSTQFTVAAAPSGCNCLIQFLPYTITNSNKVYCLNRSLSISNDDGVIFSSGVENSTLNCQGNTIVGNDATLKYGVVFSGNNKNDTVRNCNITDFYDNIKMASSDSNNTFVNNTIFSAYNIGINGYGNYHNITNNTVIACTAMGIIISGNNNNIDKNILTNNVGTGISTSYDSNIFTSNTITGSDTGISVSGDSNIFINNTIENNDYGFYLATSADNNNVTGGSIVASSLDYFINTYTGMNNYFRNTNFTASRKIWFQANRDYFNYNNATTGGIWLKTNVSSGVTITRTLTSMTQYLVQWNDSASDVTVNYTIEGLYANEGYAVYNNSVLTYSLQTNANGGLTFTIDISGTHEIKVIPSHLEVNLTNPDPGVYTDSNPLQKNQYTTFNVNATVTCRNANCGNVYGTVQYNASSAYPDTAINTAQGATPFYIVDATPIGIETTAVETDNVVGKYSSIAIDSQGYVHISHQNSTGADLRYCNNTLGTWTCTNVEADESWWYGEYSSIAIDSNNKVHISHQELYGSNLRYCNNTLGTWTCTAVETGGDVGYYSSIAIDSNNKIHISHYNNTGNDLRYCNNTAGTWTCTDVETAGIVGSYSSIAIDSNNKIHISHYNSTGGDLRYCNNTLGSWTCANVDTGGDVGWYSSIAIDSNNKIHISHQNFTGRDLRYCNNTAGTWTCTDVETAGIVGSYSSIAIDSNNKPHISHYDSTNYALRYCYTNDFSSWNCQNVSDTGQSEVPYMYVYGRGIAIKKGRLSTSTSFSPSVHTSYYKFPGQDLMYTKISKNPLSCGSLSKDQSCQLNWTVNATGAIDSAYKVGVLFNSSYSSVTQNHTNNATVQISAGGNLIVNLTTPDPGVYTDSNPLQKNQYTTFNVNATVTCSNANCGNVYGTVRYNASSAYPDTGINTTEEATPFYLTGGDGTPSGAVDTGGDVGSYSSIAIDSNDKVHISHFNDTGDVLRYCNNTLGSWTCANVETGGDVGYYSSIAIDSNNKVHISHYNLTGDGLSYCNNTLGSWTCANVETGGDVGRYSSIAIDSNDKIHISHFNDTGDVLRYCNNTLGSWTCANVETGGDVGRYSSIAIDSNDKVHISHYNTTGHDLRYCNNTLGTWTCTDVETENDIGYYSSIAIDSNDKVHISHYYYSYGDLRYCNNTLGSWTCANVETGGDVGSFSSIAIDSNDKVHISHYNATGGGSLRYCYTNDFSTWNCQKVDATGLQTSASFGRSIAIKKGVLATSTSFSPYVHMSYYNTTTDDLMYAIIVKNLLSCGSLSKDQTCQLNWTVNATGTIDSAYKIGVLFNSSYSTVTKNHTSNATVQISAGGNLIVNLTTPDPGVYTHSNPLQKNQYTTFNVNATVTCRNGNCGNVYGTVRYNASSTNPDTAVNVTTGATPFYITAFSGTLSSTTTAVDTAGDVGSYSSVAIDSQGYVHISHYSAFSGLLYCNNTLGSWTCASVDTTGTSGRYSSIAIDSNDKIHISHYDVANFALRYCNNTLGTWTCTAVATKDTSGLYSSIAIDTNDKVHISYHNYTSVPADYALSYCNNTLGSWTCREVETAGIIGTYTSIAIDSQGYVHISHEDTTNSKLRYCNNTLGTWTCTNVDNVGDYSSIAIDSNNKVHISHISGTDLRYCNNTAGSWTCTTIEGGDKFSSIAIDSNNKVHISHYNSTTQTLRYCYTNDFSNWNCQKVDDTGGDILTFGRSIAIKKGRLSTSTSFSPDVHISYYNDANDDLMYAKITKNPLSCDTLNKDQSCQLNWTVNATGAIDSAYKVGVLFNSSYSSVTQNHTNNATVQIVGGRLEVNLTYPPNMIVNQNTTFNINATITCSGANCGNVYGTARYNASSAYPDTAINTTEGDQPFYIVNSIGGAPAGIGTAAVDTGGDVGLYSSIAIDSNNKVHISHYNSTDDDLRYCNNTLGTWTCTDVETGGDVGSYSSIAIDSNNKVHISHYNSTDDDLRYCNNTAGTWTCANVETGGNVGRYSSIAIDSNNKVHISHYNYTGDDLRYCNNTAGTWTCANVETGGSVGFYSSIAIDSNNKVHISHYNYTGDDLRYCNNTAGTWTCANVETGGSVGFYSSIAIDSNNKVHISHYNNTGFDLRYCNNTLGTWTCTDVETGGDVGLYSSIAIDSNNKVHISHYDNTNKALRYCYTNDFSTWNCQKVDDTGNWGVFTNGRGIAIKKGRLVDSTSFSPDVHISYYNATTDDLMYAKITKNPLSCDTLNKDQSCQLNWTVNATGTPISDYKIGVLFNSSYSTVTKNHTNNATITIIECTESMNIGWSSIYFGNLRPNSTSNPAPGNLNNIYNITNTGTCTLKIWIKGTHIQNTSLPYPNIIGVSNFTWSNTTNDYNSGYAMTQSYDLLNSSLTPTIKNITTYYWLRVPPVYAGNYTGTLYICENTTQQSGLTSTCT